MSVRMRMVILLVFSERKVAIIVLVAGEIPLRAALSIMQLLRSAVHERLLNGFAILSYLFITHIISLIA